MSNIIKPQKFTSQIKLLKWLRQGGVKWTKKQLSENLRHVSFSTDWKFAHVRVRKIGPRTYFVSSGLI